MQYKEERLRGIYKLDFVCYDDVIVEVNANSITGPADHAQVLNYLAVSGHHTALLLNFGRRSLEHQRFVMGDPIDVSATETADWEPENLIMRIRICD